MIIQYNPNPNGKFIGDCVIRAITAVTGKAWHEVYVGLCLQKLAAFYTILDHFDSEDEVIKPTVNYSYSPPVASNVASYTSGTEFSQAIDGKDINKVLATADEAFDAVRTFAPQIYDVIIEKFFEIS